MKRLGVSILGLLLALSFGTQLALAADPTAATPPPASPVLAASPTSAPSPAPTAPAVAVPAPAATPAPTPNPNPTPAPPAKQIVVSLSQEKLFAYENGNLVGQSVVTTGGSMTRTPLGTFSVIGKRSNFMMHSPWPEDDWRWYADSWVNYALLFEPSGYFIHDAPWRHNFGPGSNAQAGTAGGDFTGTHGCVNVPFNFERDLYNWAAIGTPVIVTA
ncbi:MAG TPA: L,D-transpeptidase [Chloroflexota bacterium]|nr:L,D-transpeptidase [Chloroflexota bacterium]